MAEEERIYIPPRNPTEAQLVKIWERVLRTKPIGITDNYFELGGNSLMAAQLFALIEKTFGRKMPLATLFQAFTIQSQAELLRQEDWTPNWSSLIPLRPTGVYLPLYFVAPVGGNVLSYHDLVSHLDPLQPCYGLQAVGLDGVQKPAKNLHAIAQNYVNEVRQLQPHGPYYLAGSSFGGLVAYEMAQQLFDLGEPIALVVMFDSYGPGYPKRLPGTSRMKRKIFKIVNRIDTHLSNLTNTDWVVKINYGRAKGKKLFNRLSRRTRNSFNRLIHPLPKDLKRVHSAQYSAAKEPSRYTREPRRFSGRLVLFRANKQPLGIHPDLTLGWSKLVGDNIEVYELPGHHTSLIYEPRVKKTAARLNEILAEIHKGKL